MRSVLTRRELGLATGGTVAAVILATVTGCSPASGTQPPENPGPRTAGGEGAVNGDTLIADVIGNPLLEDYGRFLFPIAFNPP